MPFSGLPGIRHAPGAHTRTWCTHALHIQANTDASKIKINKIIFVVVVLETVFHDVALAVLELIT